MAESETYQLGSDGAPNWPAPPIGGEDENLITSKATVHLASFPPVLPQRVFFEGPAPESVPEKLPWGHQKKVPFGQHEDDEMPFDTFDGEAICPCGRIMPMMATCGFCLKLAEVSCFQIV